VGDLYTARHVLRCLRAIWINSPCTNKRPGIAIRNHECGRNAKKKKGKKRARVEAAAPTVHQLAVSFLGQQEWSRWNMDEENDVMVTEEGKILKI